MNASKVTISSETRERLNNQMLSPTKRRTLREEMIKERIRNAVGGACTKQELIAAAGFSPDANTTEYSRGISLLKSMVNRRIINYIESNKYRKTWTILGDVKVKTPEVTPSPAEIASGLVIPQEVTVELQDYTPLTSIKLVDMAKEFAWQRNSDSLREFIEYAKNAIK